MKLAPNPATKVMAEPNSANQGQARSVAKKIVLMQARPMTRPASAARSPTRSAKSPRKKTPRTIPVVKAAMPSTLLTTEALTH